MAPPCLTETEMLASRQTRVSRSLVHPAGLSPQPLSKVRKAQASLLEDGGLHGAEATWTTQLWLTQQLSTDQEEPRPREWSLEPMSRTAELSPAQTGDLISQFKTQSSSIRTKCRILVCLVLGEWAMKVKVSIIQSCPTLCNSTDCSPPCSSVRGISQARILE